MFDGYDIDSCSEESTSSSSSEDSEDEVVPSIPASLPIIKNNGQVYTYPDGKAGMGESEKKKTKVLGFICCCRERFNAVPRPASLTATCEMCGMVGVRDAFYSKTKRFCSVSCSRSYSSNSKKASILARLQVSSFFFKKKSQQPSKRERYLRFFSFFSLGKTADKKGQSLTEAASHGEAGRLRPIPSESTEPGEIESRYVDEKTRGGSGSLPASA